MINISACILLASSLSTIRLLQIIVNRLLAHEPRRDDLGVSIRQRLACQEACHAPLAVDPPEAVRQSHPPDCVLTTSTRTRFDSQEAGVCPALGRVAGLWVEFGRVVDELGVCGWWAAAGEVGSEDAVSAMWSRQAGERVK